MLSSAAFWKAARFTVLFTVVGVFGSWARRARAGPAAAHQDPGRRHLQGAAAAALGRADRRLLHRLELAGRHAAQPASRSCSTTSGSGTPLFLADPTWPPITGLRLQGLGQLPVHDDDDQRRPGQRRRRPSTRPPAWTAPAGGSSSRQITLPMIARSTYISWILMTIFCVNDFPTIYLLTGGGPVDATTSLVVLAYRTVFQNFQVGPGVAIAFLMTSRSSSSPSALPADPKGERRNERSPARNRRSSHRPGSTAAPCTHAKQGTRGQLVAVRPHPGHHRRRRWSRSWSWCSWPLQPWLS